MFSDAPSTKLRIARKAILWFQLSVIAIFGFVLLSNWSIWLPLGVIAAGVVVSAPLYLVVLGIWRLFQRKRHGNFLRFATCTAIVALVLAGLPLFYLLWRAEAKPLAAPLVTMTDGRRTVVLQGMWHVGSEAFYKSVVFDLGHALREGYTLFYEGVRPSPGEGDEWASTYVGGGGDVSQTYKAFADLCGLKFQQDYFDLMETDRARRPERHVVADVTTLQLKQEFDRLVDDDPAFARWAAARARQATPQASGQKLAEMMQFVQTRTDGQRYLAGVVCRGIFSLQGEPRDKPAGDEAGDALGRVVIDFRNRYLVETIVRSNAEKIYITYGTGHIPGVIDLLRREAKPWRLTSVKWLQAVATPKEFEGALPIVAEPPSAIRP